METCAHTDQQPAARRLAQMYEIEARQLLQATAYYGAATANWAAWLVAFLGWILGWRATVGSVLAYFGACIGLYFVAGQVIRRRAARLLVEAKRLRELHGL